MRESRHIMDIKKLNQLTWRRSRPIVLSLGLLLIVLSLFTGFRSTNSWHNRQNFIHSKKAKEQYSLYIGAKKTEEKEINKKYGQNKDYQKAVDYYNNQGNDAPLIFNAKTGKFSIKTESFKNFYGYIRSNIFGNVALDNLISSGYIVTATQTLGALSLLSLIFVTTGFLISFLDYKTNFVLILFSSGYRRKEIFKSTIKTSLLPLIGLSSSAIAINLAILYSSIPHQYIDYPLVKIIIYHICLLATAICYYFIGLFSGIVFGQIFTGIVSLIGFLFGLGLIQTNLLDLFDALFHKNKNQIYYDILFARFDSYPHWAIITSITIILTLILYFISQISYNRLSLEERGNYLLFPKLRFPISLIAAFFASYSLSGNLGLSYSYNEVSFQSILKGNILPGILVFLITFSLFMILNNYKKIYDKIGKRFSNFRVID